MSKKPILDGFEPRAKPVSSPSAAKTTKWTFSFIDFSQVELFGLNKSSNNWFSALLSQLKKVSTIDIDRLNKDKTLQSDLRYHRIEWGAERIPVNRNYFNWIDSNVLKNEEEFPFFQFQITTGLGRVVGYWYEDIFHIIAFDPLHNLQPSKKHNYQIRPCSPRGK